MSEKITSVADMEACVGVAGLPVRMKIIDHLDQHARAWIGASHLAFFAAGGDEGPRVAVAGGAAGFATTPDAHTISLSLDALDPFGALKPGQGAGFLFLAPGVGETLRANGRVRAVTSAAVEVEVEECFIHCAKALIRSDFWSAEPCTSPAETTGFLAATRFLALATMDATGRVDISPKGDPAGLLVHHQGNHAVLAERPGNRLAFGYRNILQEPRVAALCVIPGANAVLALRGDAHLTADEQVRQAFVVDGKTPVLATVIAVAQDSIADSPALVRAGPWRGEPSVAKIDPAAAFVAHVKLNKARGAQATLLRLAVNRGLVAKGLQSNYRTDLY